MKKFSIFYILCLIFITSCSNNDQAADSESVANPVSVSQNETKERCLSESIRNKYYAANPDALKKRIELEKQINSFIKNNKTAVSTGILTVPVHVNVLYKNDEENISVKQIQSQINVLNQAFSSTNSDFSKINNTVFKDVAARDTEIRFVWDSRSVTRKKTTETFWGGTAVQQSRYGGIDATAPTTKLNIWVCDFASLGMAIFPEEVERLGVDGVIVDYQAFGTLNKFDRQSSLFSYLLPDYRQGKTLVHEVGHWLNVDHIWGNEICGDDFTSDTPLHTNANTGCPSYPKYNNCPGISPTIEMTMNYMDYVNDPCMYAFTYGQQRRMRATLRSTRSSFVLKQ